MYYLYGVNDVKLILELLLILGLIIVAFFIFVALCMGLNRLFKIVTEKFLEQAKMKIKQKTENERLNKIITFFKWCRTFVLMHESILNIILFICIMFGVPLAVQNNQMNIGTEFKKYIKIGTTRDWFGFWGPYIGCILSVSFAFYNTKWQLNTHKYANDYKQLSFLQDAGNAYLETIQKYRQELAKIKSETVEDKYNDINEFVSKFNTDFDNYLAEYSKVVLELSSLNSMKASEILFKYCEKNLKFTVSLNKLQSQKATIDDWNEAINMASTVFDDFYNLNHEVFKLWSKCNFRS